MNILLTGSTGFLGQHLQKRLEKDGHTVIPYHRSYTLLFESSEDDRPKPEIIIHCAGEITYAHKMFQSNVVLTENLLKFAQREGIRKFIHVGSSSEYKPSSFSLRETDPCVPFDIYSATKLAATSLCLGYAAQYDMDICVARPFSLFGPKDTARKLIPRLLAKIPMDVFRGNHDWLWVGDFCDGIVTLLNSPKEKTKGDVVNFGAGVSLTNLQVVRTIEGILGQKLPVTIKDGQQDGYFSPDLWRADNTKAQIKYGWRPKFNLESGLQEYILNTNSL